MSIENHNHILLPINAEAGVFNESNIAPVSFLFSAFFTGENEHNLNYFLHRFSFDGIKDFVSKVFRFFREEVGVNRMNIDEVRNIDAKELSYRFAKYMNIDVKSCMLGNTAEDKLLRTTISSLGQVCFYNILFPFLNSRYPETAALVKQKIKDAALNYSNKEGISYDRIEDLFQLEKIPVVIPSVNRKKQAGLNLKEERNKIYFKFEIKQIRKIERFAILIADDYNIIAKKSKSDFVKLLTSEGKEVECVRCNVEKLEHLAYLIYRLHKRKENEQKFLFLSFGKGYFELAQQSFVDYEGNNLSKSLKAISSEINRNPLEHQDTIIQVEQILTELKKIHNDIR